MNIAIVGGIASGKSEVLKTLKSLGAFVISADEINRGLLIDNNYVEKIKLFFPEAVIDGKIDKFILKKIIFSNDLYRKKLNEISHPIIHEKILSLIDSSKINFIEIPLFIEANYSNMFDYVWAIKSSKMNRLLRLTCRDNISRTQAIDIMEIQHNEDKVYEIANEIIINDSDINSLKTKVKKLYDKLISSIN